MPTEWAGLVAGVALAAVLAALALVGLWMGRLRREQSCRFVCPVHQKSVECRIVQDPRTGQWKQVQACSAFADPREVTCEQDCARLMNLGFRLPATRQA
jgi:hypothetical protein